MSSDLIARTADHVRQLFQHDSSGHDWGHVERVWKMARRLAKDEGADTQVVELAALLHDIADWKFHGGDETAGPRAARQWLTDHHADPALVDHVAEIIAHLSFKGAGVPTPMRTCEGAVVQDADRLEAIGAIGIGRTFAYGGHRGHAMYDPDIPAELHQSFADYKQKKGTTINHFHEKLLLLKDRMNTAAGRKIAEQRHAFMEAFLTQFMAEVNGEA